MLSLLAVCSAGAIEEANANKKPAGSTTYDQRQTGKYNLHVNIKDVQFFSLSDSLASIGDYGDYGDYGNLEGGFGDTDTDYDAAHLTVNPLFAFLGSQKPTTVKPTTTATTEKRPSSLETSSTSESSSNSMKETSTEKVSAASGDNQEESSIKPAQAGDKRPQQVNDTIDYEEIPVEVQYYRANHQKLPSNGRHAAVNRFHKRQPSVQIIDGHGRASNVKIIENESPTVKICNRGEFRDSLGRCRIRARRGAPGL